MSETTSVVLVRCCPSKGPATDTRSLRTAEEITVTKILVGVDLLSRVVVNTSKE